MTTGNPLTATRCGTCGRNAVRGGACASCGTRIVPPVREMLPQVDVPIVRPVLTPAVFQAAPLARHSPALPPPSPLARVTGQSLERWLLGDETSGRIIIIRQAPHEPMDFDIWRWVAIPVWGLLLLSAPLVIAIIVWQSVGVLPALGVAGLTLIVFRFIFSDRLLQSWHLTAAFNGRHIVEPMPVLMARLRHADGRELQLRLKGHLRGGTPMEGDRVRVRGTWRRGAFQVSSLACDRTGASTTPLQPNAQRLAVAGLGLLVFECLWLTFVGIPWVTTRFDHMQRELKRSVPVEIRAPRFPEIQPTPRSL